MRAPVGYQLGKCLRARPKSEVYAAVRESDGREVVLKRFLPRPSRPRGPSARAEFELMRKLRIPRLIEAIELRTDLDPPVLVVERAAGQSLQSWLDSTRPSVRARLQERSEAT
jgi:serine/threonine protein kinase